MMHIICGVHDQGVLLQVNKVITPNDRFTPHANTVRTKFQPFLQSATKYGVALMDTF